MPAVVPQLKSITLGGARRRRRHRGVVVPARTRARHGHRVRRADRRRTHRHLHAGQRASRPVPRLSQFVRHARLRAARSRRARCRSSRYVARRARPLRRAPPRASPTSRGAAPSATLDFLDGVVFAPRRAGPDARRASSTPRPTPATTRSSASTTGRCASASSDFLTTRDYLWRWDTDWFWCSKNVGAQHPLRAPPARPQAAQFDHLPEDHALEQPLGRRRARSTGCAALHAGVGDPGRRHSARRAPRSSSRSCTTRSASCRSGSARSGRREPARRFRSIRSRPARRLRQLRLLGHRRAPGSRGRRASLNRRIEQRGRARSAASSRSIRTRTTREDEFWAIYDRGAYDALKRRYDPAGALGDLYAKCVLRH